MTLIEFLITRDCLSPFISNYNRVHSASPIEFIKEHKHDRNVIDTAFLWEETPEGHDHWDSIDHDWRMVFDLSTLPSKKIVFKL